MQVLSESKCTLTGTRRLYEQEQRPLYASKISRHAYEPVVRAVRVLEVLA